MDNRHQETVLILFGQLKGDIGEMKGDMGELKGKMDSILANHAHHDKRISKLEISKAWVLGAAATVSLLIGVGLKSIGMN